MPDNLFYGTSIATCLLILTAKSAGNATIKAKVDKKTYKCKVTVNAAAAPAQAAAASLSETKLEMIAGHQKQLTLNNASGYVTWSSNNHRVADVASDGTVYAKFYGTCVIRATCGGKTYNCAVSVTFPDPECYPKTSYSYSGDSGELKIDTFEAKFVSYQQDRTDVVTIEDGDYFFFYPCIYRIHLKGNFPYKTSDANISLLSMWEGHIYADFFGARLKIVTDENGDFDVTQDVRFSGPAEIIYMVD